jgi:hypothetical protein
MGNVMTAAISAGSGLGDGRSVAVHEAIHETREALIERRRKAMRPIGAALAEQGRTQVWLAGKLGIGKARFSNYLFGFCRSPKWVIETSCKLLEISSTKIFESESAEVLLQQEKESRGGNRAGRKKGSNAA